MSKNKKRILVSAIVIAFAIWAAPARRTSAAQLPEGWLKDWKEATAQAKESKKPILAVFSAEWCGPCQMMVREVYPKPAVIETLKKYVHVYIDVDKDKRTPDKFQIEGYPTFVLLDSEGKEEDRFSGGMPEKMFLKQVQSHPEYMAAMARLKPQLANPPDTAEFWKEVGDAYMLKGKSEPALDAYKKALAKDPSDKAGVGDFVYFQENLPRSEDDLPAAEKALASFESKYPKSHYLAEVTFIRGLIAADLGKQDEAIATIEEALKRFPGNDLEDRMKSMLGRMKAERDGEAKK